MKKTVFKFWSVIGLCALLVLVSTGISEASFSVQISGSNFITEKKSARLSVTFTPAQLDESGFWETNDDNILKIDKNGIITGVAEGETYITFTASQDARVYDVLFVEVVPKATPDIEVRLTSENNIGAIRVGDTVQLTPVFSPDVKDKTGKWQSNNATIATVDEHGLVTGISGGTVPHNLEKESEQTSGTLATNAPKAVITFVPNADETKFATFEVKVTQEGNTDELDEAAGCNAGAPWWALILLFAALAMTRMPLRKTVPRVVEKEAEE